MTRGAFNEEGRMGEWAGTRGKRGEDNWHRRRTRKMAYVTAQPRAAR